MKELKVNKMITKQNVLEYLDQCTLLELSSLVDDIKERYNITEQVPIQILSPAETIEKKEQTEFDVVLVESGQFKIKVIKEVRSITGIGLRESKVLVDELDIILKNVPIAVAEEAKTKLEAVGARIEIK